jgi:hypothetical protein
MANIIDLNVHITGLEIDASPREVKKIGVCIKSGNHPKIHDRRQSVSYLCKTPVYDCKSLFVDISQIFLKLSSALNLDAQILFFCRVGTVEPQKLFTFELRVLVESRNLDRSAKANSKQAKLVNRLNEWFRWVLLELKREWRACHFRFLVETLKALNDDLNTLFKYIFIRVDK